jgi:hypothetical protein
MERISGVSVGEADALNLSKEDRNDVGLYFCFDTDPSRSHAIFFFNRSPPGLLTYVSKNSSNFTPCRPILIGPTFSGILKLVKLA